MTVFNFTLDAVTSNKSKTVIKMSLSNKEARAFTARYLDSIDKELRVSFDDPQMEMDVRPAPSGRGSEVIIDGSGVVESVKPTERENDNEVDLFSQAEPESEAENVEVEIDVSEVEFEDGDAPGESDADAEEADVENQEDIEAEAIEEFILSEKPVFDNIPYNFAEMLRQRREDGHTWMEIAKINGATTGKLQSAYRTYKQLVVGLMRQQGVA